MFVSRKQTITSRYRSFLFLKCF